MTSEAVGDAVSGGIVIGPVREADHGEIFTLQRACWVTEAQLHDDVRVPPLTESFAELSAALRGLAFKATLGHRIVGSVRARAEGRLLHIGRLMVAPDLQGLGIGSRLLRELEDAAPPGIDRFALFTGPRSLPNVRLYQRLGYTVVNPDRADQDLIHLEKPR